MTDFLDYLKNTSYPGRAKTESITSSWDGAKTAATASSP